MNNLTLINYAELYDALSTINPDIEPAQIHGLCSGYFCAAPNKKPEVWVKKILGENKSSSAQASLKKLYEYTADQLKDFSFEFSLLLPEDETDINRRAEALGLWCQGFLTGLTQSGIQIENRKPSDLSETLNDLIEISKVNYGDLLENEEDESAYTELVEYVRMAVLMVFQELNTREK